MGDENCYSQGQPTIWSRVGVEARAGHEERDGNDAANQSVGEIAQQPIPCLRKCLPDKKQLRQGAHGECHQAHDQDNLDAGHFGASKLHPRIATRIALTSQPHPGLITAPGTAASKLARQTSATVLLRISTASKPAK